MFNANEDDANFQRACPIKRGTSMTNHRVATIAGVVIAGLLVACGAPSVETVGTTEQRVQSDDPGTAACGHAVCAVGPALPAACDPCAATLCAKDPYCCSSTWDATCIGEVASICKQSCTATSDAGGGGDAGDAAASACAHAVCASGSALASGCEACATKLCAKDPYCCTTTWDATCVNEVNSLCAPQKCN